MKAHRVLTKYAKFDWVLLYECMAFIFAEQALLMVQGRS